MALRRDVVDPLSLLYDSLCNNYTFVYFLYIVFLSFYRPDTTDPLVFLSVGHLALILLIRQQAKRKTSGKGYHGGLHVSWRRQVIAFFEG